MLSFNIDREKLEFEFNKISSWDDWDIIVKEIFRRDEWQETDIDTLGIDLERPVISLDGYDWESTTNSYDIAPEIYHLYEKKSIEAFAKLEPEAAIENKAHPEWYAKWCVYCRRWSRHYPKDNCPKCGHELLPLPLNE